MGNLKGKRGSRDIRGRIGEWERWREGMEIRGNDGHGFNSTN